MRRSTRLLTTAALLLTTLLVADPSPAPAAAALSPAEDVIIGISDQLPNGVSAVLVDVSADEEHVVYAAVDGARRFLYSVSTGGGPPTLLFGSDNGSIMKNITVTDDGERVLFISDHVVLGRERLYSTPIGGGALTDISGIFTLASGDVHDYVVTSAGDDVVFTADWQVAGQTELFLTDVDGGPVAPIGDGVNPFDLTMSPVGQHVVYRQEVLGGVQIRSASLDTGVAAQIGSVIPAGRTAQSALITPSGSHVVFRADIDVAGQHELFAAPIAGGAGVQLNPPLAANANVICCSTVVADGERVVYRIQRAGANTSLHSVRLDGSGHVNLAGMEADDIVLTVRPTADGSRVAFIGDLDLDASRHLYSVAAVGGPLVNIDSAVGSDTRVLENYRLSHDGQSVAYGLRLDGVTEHVVEAGPVDDNESVRLSEGGGAGHVASLVGISHDDEHVFYTHREPGSAANELRRVPLTGGDADVFELPVDGASTVTAVQSLSIGVTVITATVAAVGTRLFVAGTAPVGGGGGGGGGPTDDHGGSVFVGLPPSRVFESRVGEPGPGPKGFIPAGGTVDVQITGVAGVPASASAVALNVTVTETQAAGYTTVFPTGEPMPLASSLNATAADQDRPNLVVVPIGADGRVSIHSQSGSHVVADVMGYFTPVVGPATAGRIMPLDPFRAFDTRVGEAAPGPKGLVGPGESIDVQIAGVGGVPDDAAAVVINITGTDAVARGFVSVWPAGSTMPLVSTLNLMAPGETTPNLAIVPLGDDGRVSLHSQSGVHLLGDITGYVTGSGAVSSTSGVFVPMTPVRSFDTRTGPPATPPKGFVDAGTTVVAQMTGALGVPEHVGLVLFNLTGDQAATGFVTAHADDIARPQASTLNLNGPLDIRANAAAVRPSWPGALAFYSQSGAHLVADIAGYTLP